MSRRYLLDANPLIEAKNRYYGFDICPGFWQAVLTQHAAKRVFSIDRIESELQEQKDELSQWVKEQVPETFFKKTKDKSVVDEFQEMVKWVYSVQRFTPAAKSSFASGADGWVVAYAKVNDLTVVTHEQYAAEAKRTVPIPNLCLEFRVAYVNTFEMLRELGEGFVRRPK